MNQEHRFERADTGPPATLRSPSESGHFAARARQQRADGAAAVIATLFHSVTGALRALLAHSSRWEQQRATPDALMRCSDRVLADIGIERQYIPSSPKASIPPSTRQATANSRAGGPQHARASLRRGKQGRRGDGSTASSRSTPTASSTRSDCGAQTYL